MGNGASRKQIPEAAYWLAYLKMGGPAYADPPTFMKRIIELLVSENLL